MAMTIKIVKTALHRQTLLKSACCVTHCGCEIQYHPKVAQVAGLCHSKSTPSLYSSLHSGHTHTYTPTYRVIYVQHNAQLLLQAYQSILPIQLCAISSACDRMRVWDSSGDDEGDDLGLNWYDNTSIPS